MKLIDITDADQLLHEELIELEEVANLYSTETGVNNVVIWVNGGGDKLQHGPRIKVTRGTKFRNNESSTIPLTGMPRIIGNSNLSQDEFAQILKWIKLNRKVILDYANDKISTATMITSIKKV